MLRKQGSLNLPEQPTEAKSIPVGKNCIQNFAAEGQTNKDIVKVIGIRPMAPVLNTGPLEGI